MGFVVEGRDWSEGEEEGQASFSAFVFESNTEGEKVNQIDARMWADIVSWECWNIKHVACAMMSHPRRSPVIFI